MADISIVICTRNRAHALGKLFDSLANLDLVGGPAIEVVVVDNGSKDKTKEAICAFVERVPFPVRYVFEKRAGLGAAHSAALPHATGEILLFTDDDCIVAPDWPKIVASSFADRTELKIVGGRVELYNPADAPMTIKTSREPCELHDISDVGTILLGCNFAVARCVFNEIGVFDARFGPGTPFFAGDEIDLVYRAFCQGGVRILYDPGQLVYHNHGRSTEEARRLREDYLIARGALMAKHFFSGNTGLIRFLYWDMLHALRWRGRDRKEAFAACAFQINGIFRYLRYGLGRRSS